VAADELGALAHARQAEVSTPFVRKHRSVDTLSIVPDLQPKLPGVVRDFHFDPASVRVAKGVAQRFAGNPVDIVAQDRMEIPRRALYGHMDDGAILVRSAGCELVAQRADRHGEIVGGPRGRTQVLNRIASFGDRLRRSIDRARELLLGFARTLREHVVRRLKAEQHPVKGLQQRIVEVRATRVRSLTRSSRRTSNS
jgi:hypothetical protein